jgi:hypothetical protein
VTLGPNSKATEHAPSAASSDGDEAIKAVTG